MLAPSGGGLILYQAYGNLYAMTGRKAHLLEDKQIPSVGVFDEVFLALGWHLEEIYVTLAHLEKKRTRLRLYSNYLEEPRIQSVETVSLYSWRLLLALLYVAIGTPLCYLRDNVVPLRLVNTSGWGTLTDASVPMAFAKPVKAIFLPQDVPSTSDRRLIELENQVQCLMEAYLAPKQPTQVKKITFPCEIYSGPHDTQYCMENPEQAFIEYASSCTDKAGGKWYTFKPEQAHLGDTYNPSWKSHPNLRKSRKAKITVGEGITMSVFGVKGIELGQEEAPYWTTLGKRKSYKPSPSSDEPINWDKPLKTRDGAWHAKIRLIDPDGEEFTKTLQSIPTLENSSKGRIQGRSSTWITFITPKDVVTRLATRLVNKEKRFLGEVDNLFGINDGINVTLFDVISRLVLEGFRQKSRIDYFDTYALVARISTIRLLTAMAIIHNLIIHHMDVKTTFLNGELDEEVYMNQPHGFIMHGNENKTRKSNSVLHVLKHYSNLGASCVGEYLKITMYNPNGSPPEPEDLPKDTPSLEIASLGLDDGVAASFQRSRIHKPHAHTQAFKVNPQVDQESQIKMIHVKEMMQDNDLKNSMSKDKGSRSRSQSMNEQSHYKQDKTKTRQSINVKSHILNVIGGTEECEERDLNIGGDC
ncbi:MAK10-like protein [Tanacetum coccineum]